MAYYTNGRADQEQNDPDARPVISGGVENMDQYDIIIISYPIWHGQAPRIISTFLESYDFSGKTILPFCTSHSSGIGSSADNLHVLCSESVKWLDGRRFKAGDSKESVAIYRDSRSWNLINPVIHFLIISQNSSHDPVICLRIQAAPTVEHRCKFHGIRPGVV